jgi:hypothetical protein
VETQTLFATLGVLFIVTLLQWKMVSWYQSCTDGSRSAGMEGNSRFVLPIVFNHIRIRISALWPAQNFGLCSAPLFCLRLAIHSSYSFPWHMIVAVSFQEEIERRYRELRLDWLYYVYRCQEYDPCLYLFLHTTYN